MRKQKTKTTLFWSALSCAMILIVMVSTLSSAAEDPAKFPSKPISMLINFNPGSSTDLTSRKLADLAGKILGKPIVPENRPGGGGVIATYDVAKAPPDGYTIGGGSSGAFLLRPHFFKKVPYNAKEDFSWIMIHTEQSMPFAVLPNARWKNFKEFIEEARRNPGKLKVGTAGVWGTAHLVIEQTSALEKVKLAHVPTSGGAEIVTHLMGGHVDAAMATILSSYLKAKRVRALAVERRMEFAPDIPTFEEMGYKTEVPVAWLGVFAPKKIPSPILKKLADAFKRAAEDSSFKDLLDTLTLSPMYQDPESARQRINKDFDIMARLAKMYKAD